MKKICLFALAGILCSVAHSQTRWGGQIIGNLTSANIPSFGEGLIKNKSAVGFGAGVVAEVPLGTEFTFRPSLNFLKKGSGFDINFSDPSLGYREETKFNANLYYAELPLHFALNGSLGSGKYFIGMGPSFGLGLFGNAKVEYIYQDANQPLETETEEVDPYDSEDGGFKRFEVSASIIGGLQWNSGFFINAGYLAGMTNLARDSDDEGSYKQKGFQLTIGKFFTKKK
jgi:hypothetical protein